LGAGAPQTDYPHNTLPRQPRGGSAAVPTLLGWVNLLRVAGRDRLSLADLSPPRPTNCPLPSRGLVVFASTPLAIFKISKKESAIQAPSAHARGPSSRASGRLWLL
jgi:hypothetical protein